MTDLTIHHASVPAPILEAMRVGIAAARQSFRDHRRRREIYLRTLRELHAYRPHELADLRIQSDDIERLAREQAGW